MADLTGKRGAVLIAAKFQDEEGVEPVRFLREQGMDMVYVGLEKGVLAGKNGREEVEVDLVLDEADPATFDFLYLPGGAAPEILRLDVRALAFTRSFFDAAKPVAAICHGPQVLISAQVLAGRTVTCYAGIRDDVRLAGARYQDKPAVTDRNLVTSRVPGDIDALNEAILALLVPAEPEKPAKSARPTKPEEPADSAEPTEPVDPAETVAAADPSDETDETDETEETEETESIDS